MFGQSLAGDGQDLGIAQIDEIDSRVDRMVVVVGILERRADDHSPHQLGFHRKPHVDRIAEQTRVLLFRRVFDDAQSLSSPSSGRSAGILPTTANRSSTRARIPRLVQIPVVGGDHAPLGTVHEDRRAAGRCLELLAKRADQIRAENADVVAEDFGMNRVVDQGSDRSFPGRLWPG